MFLRSYILIKLFVRCGGGGTEKVASPGFNLNKALSQSIVSHKIKYFFNGNKFEEIPTKKE